MNENVQAEEIQNFQTLFQVVSYEIETTAVAKGPLKSGKWAQQKIDHILHFIYPYLHFT